MRFILITISLLVLIIACAPQEKYYDVYTQQEFDNYAKSLGYKFIVRVQPTNSITDKGIGKSIQSFAHTAANETLASATEGAMSMCPTSCIVSSINGEITPYAKELIEKAKEQKLLETQKAEKQKIKSEQEKAIAEIEKLKTEKELKLLKISIIKNDCKELGFKDDTEAMGNCVLKLMELQVNNSPTIVTTTTSNSSQEIVDIEKQKLQAQREALKLQQDQLKAEQERVAQERRKAIQRNANKSIQQGQCLMNGGSTWDCM